MTIQCNATFPQSCLVEKRQAVGPLAVFLFASMSTATAAPFGESNSSRLYGAIRFSTVGTFGGVDRKHEKKAKDQQLVFRFILTRILDVYFCLLVGECALDHIGIVVAGHLTFCSVDVEGC